MNWTAPRTWVASETVTAALLNTHIRDNFLAAPGVIVGTVNTANSATSTGATEVLLGASLLALTSVEANRNYWIDLYSRVSSSVAGDTDIVSVRALQGTVLITSPRVAVYQCVPAATGGNDFSVRMLWTPSAGGAWNLQVGVVRAVGSGNATIGAGLMNTTLTVSNAL